MMKNLLKIYKIGLKFFLKKVISNQRRLLIPIYSVRYKLTPWIIKVTPRRITAKSGLVIENPPRPNVITPKIIINTEAIFDTPSPPKIPAIPMKIIRIPIM